MVILEDSEDVTMEEMTNTFNAGLEDGYSKEGLTFDDEITSFQPTGRSNTPSSICGDSFSTLPMFHYPESVSCF